MKFQLLNLSYKSHPDYPPTWVGLKSITFAHPKVATQEGSDDPEDAFTIIQAEQSKDGEWSFRWLQHKNGSFAWMEFSLFVTPEIIEWYENQ